MYTIATPYSNYAPTPNPILIYTLSPSSTATDLGGVILQDITENASNNGTQKQDVVPVLS